MGGLRIGIAIWTALCCGDAVAGAWTLPKGDAQAIVTTGYTYSIDEFDGSGRLVARQALEKYEVRAFAEYGVTDWATAFVQPEWRRKTRGDDSVEGLGRVDLGLRTRIWREGPNVAAVQGTVRVPGAGDALAPLNGGDTEWEVDARALYGRSFTLLDKPGFLDAQLGYRHRLGDPPDEVRLDVTAGWEVRDRTLAMVQSFNTLSMGDADQPFADSQEHKIAVSTVYRIDDRWSVQIGGTATAYGTNVLREQGIFAGLWAKF